MHYRELRAEPGRKKLLNTTKPEEKTDTYLALLEVKEN